MLFRSLRGAIPIALGMDLPVIPAILVCVLGNMLPVPVIYFFARKVLLWGKDKKYIGKFFTFCLEKGERAGQALVKKAGRGGLFIALLIFVGIPLPGTGAWTGALVASVMGLKMKRAIPPILLGVATAGLIMLTVSLGVVSIFA